MSPLLSSIRGRCAGLGGRGFASAAGSGHILRVSPVPPTAAGAEAAALGKPMEAIPARSGTQKGCLHEQPLRNLFIRTMHVRTMEQSLLADGRQLLLCLLVVMFLNLHQFLPPMTWPCCFVY